MRTANVREKKKTKNKTIEKKHIQQKDLLATTALNKQQ